MKLLWRSLYTLLYLWCLPLVIYNEKRRHYADISFWHWLQAKLGRNFNKPEKNITHRNIWIHAVSMGEVNTAILFIKKWLELNSNDFFVITTHTITGRKSAQSFVENPQYKNSCALVIPTFDFSFCVANFINNYHPQCLILTESDLWPAVSWVCQKKNLPFFIINARMSPKTAKRINKLITFGAHNLLESPQAIIAQNQEMANNWRWLINNQQNIHIGGQIKYDIEVSNEQLILGEKFSQYLKKNTNKKVLMFASTREGEEEIALKVWQKLGIDFQNKYFLAIVPRHPSRVEKVGELINQFDLQFLKRSQLENTAFDESNVCRVWIGDSIGEMFAYYKCADVVVIGGGLLPYGGQNPIEAFAVGVPTILGAHTYNFTKVRNDAINLSATLAINSVSTEAIINELCQLIKQIDTNPTLINNMINNQQKLIKNNQGAIVKTINIIKTQIS